MDFQPYDALPNVLASADVLVAVLEPDAGRYSVPSKVLSYLCAARPILGIMPAQNEAAATLRSSGAGLSVDPGDHQQAISAISTLLADPELRARMGESGRRYAEATFDISEIGARFEKVLRQVNDSVHRPRSMESALIGKQLIKGKYDG
jgi:glycosyltransferase involved in cell wall biosynthesis